MFSKHPYFTQNCSQIYKGACACKKLYFSDSILNVNINFGKLQFICKETEPEKKFKKNLEPQI